MLLEYHQLGRPEYIFAGGKHFQSAFQGLRTAGPYSSAESPNQPSILFVYPNELKDEARKLYLSLRDGVGPFTGTEALLHFSMPSSRVKLLNTFSIPRDDHHAAAAQYQSAVSKWLSENDERPDIALILHPRTDRSNEHNPYLSSKYPLLKAGIPSQVVTTDLLGRRDLFQWSAATIALAMFAKMGGMPWAVETHLSEDSIIVGINRAVVSTGSLDAIKRYFGFASTFSHHGIYLGTEIFPPADTRAKYLIQLQKTLGNTLKIWRQAYGSPVNLILHVRKEINRDETEIISEVLRSADGNLVRSYVVVKLTELEHALIADTKGGDAMLPPAGVFVRLAARRGLLQITGSVPQSQAQGKTATHPIHIKCLASSEHAPCFEDLCTHVLALAAMNWRGLNAEASPVSIRYPQLVAELLGRFTEAGFDVSELIGTEVMKRPWFL